MDPAPTDPSPKLVRKPGWLVATMIVLGSGLFITSFEASRLVGSPGGLLAAWAVAGVSAMALTAPVLWTVFRALLVPVSLDPASQGVKYRHSSNQRLGYIVSADQSDYTPLDGAVHELRRKLPETGRPYRTFVDPAPVRNDIGLAVSLLHDLNPYAPGTSAIGSLIILMGIFM